MNKCNVFALLLLVTISNIMSANWSKASAQKSFIDHSKQKSSQIYALSYLVGYFNDKAAAARYDKYGSFYPIKKESKADLDTAIDLGLYPLVDYGVGRLMRPLRNMAYMNGVKNGIPPYAIDFIADEAQLVTSAAIVRSIAFVVQKKLDSISSNDLKNFGKSCCVQVSCDAIDETIISPIVKMTIGGDEAWSAFFVHGAAKFGLGCLFKNVFNLP